MKKLLSALAALTLTSSSAISVVACADPDNTADNGDALPDTNFTLETTSVTMNVKNPVSIKVTNWSVLNDNSKPTKFSYDKTGIITMTVGLDGELTLTPLTDAVESVVNVTVASGVHSEVVQVNVKEVTASSKFTLDKNELSLNTNEIGYLNIIDWDGLTSSDLRPSKFEVDSSYAKIELDSPNQRLIVSSNSLSTDSIKAVISDNTGQSTTITIKITPAVFDLAAESLVANIAAGNMEDGLIDPTIAVGQEGFIITDEAVITGFNVLNNVNFSANDVDVVRTGDGTSEGNNGIGTSFILRAKSTSSVIKGEKILTLNQNIDPLLYYANKNLGEIRLFSGALNKLDEVLKSDDAISLGSMIFEQVGVRNPQLQYLKGNFLIDDGTSGGLPNPPGKQIMNNSDVSATVFKINGMPTLGGIFKPNVDVQFTYKFVEEDRITISEGLPESGVLNVDSDLLVKNSKAGQKDAKTQMYNQLNETFRNKITLEDFIETTNIVFDTKNDAKKAVDFKLDILPNSEKLYGHDGAAFNSFMFADSTAAIFTGGGNLNKYEESGAIAEKYSAGMGYFDFLNASKGQFWQGHDIMALNQTLSVETPLEDFSFTVGETISKDFTIENAKEATEVTIETTKGNFDGEFAFTVESSEFDSSSNTTKGKLQFTATSTSSTSRKYVTVNLKVNGFSVAEFDVTVNAAS